MHNIEESIQHFSSSEKVWYLFRQVKVHWKFAKCQGHAAHYSFQTEKAPGEYNTAEDWKRTLETKSSQGGWVGGNTGVSHRSSSSTKLNSLEALLYQTAISVPHKNTSSHLLGGWIIMLLSKPTIMLLFRPNNLTLRMSVESWGIKNI